MIKTYEGDIEFEAATDFVIGDAAMKARLTVREFLPIVDAFYDGMHRIQAFHFFPIHLMSYMQMIAIAHATAVIRTGGDPTNLDQELTEDQHALAAKIFEQIKQRVERVDLPGGLQGHLLRSGAMTLKEMLLVDLPRKDSSATFVGVAAIFAAMIMAGYAALET